MRIALLSDIHANLPALEAVAADLPPIDEVWVLGDIVGYGPQPNEVIATLQAMGARSVLGNHDGAAVGTVETAYFNPDARAAIEWTATVVDANARSYIATLPEVRRDGAVTAVHGSPRDPIWEYITGPSVAADNFGAFDTRLCLFGHTHLPSVFGATDGTVTSVQGLPGETGAPSSTPAASASRGTACGMRPTPSSPPGTRRRTTPWSSGGCGTTSSSPSGACARRGCRRGSPSG
jgi:predicted phosphodiesterase